MPELPDVETVVRRLRRQVSGRRITRARVLDARTVRRPSRQQFARRLRGRYIQRVARRGKYLLLGLDGDLALVVHLRMTGDLRVVDAAEPVHPHTRVLLALDGRHLRFIDQRRLGHMDLVTAAELAEVPGLRALGAEPLSRGLTLGRFRELLARGRGAVKSLLLRQDVVAGIGNIYADEILFQARLRPDRTVASLGPADVRRLYQAIRGVLARAVRRSSRHAAPVGTLLDERGKGGRCPRCGRPLVFTRVGGRGTYYCDACQR